MTPKSDRTTLKCDQACACGSHMYTVIARAVYTRTRPPWPYSLLRCQMCGLVRTLPIPSVAQYESGYADSTDETGRYVPRGKPWVPIIADHVSRVAVTALAPSSSSYQVLDVGCNGGELVAALRERGFDARGIDVDPIAVDYGDSRGLPICVCDLASLHDGRRYDMLTLSHTLEHIEDLADTLRAAGRALRVGGLLYIRVPNCGGWIARLMGNDWGFLLPHQHVWQFEPRTLVRAVIDTGAFRQISITACTGLEYANTPGFKGTIKRIVNYMALRTGHGDELVGVFARL